MYIAAVHIDVNDTAPYFAMGAVPDIDDIAGDIYDRARRGSAVNPGLPDALSRLIVAQTQHETATSIGGRMVPYTSNAFVIDNNAIGYKWVGSRYQTAPGIKSSEGDFYGHYRYFDDSIEELIDWIYRRRAEGRFPADLSSIRTADEYARLLKQSGYYGAPESQYAAGLKRWGAGMIQAAGAGILGLALLAAAGYVIMKKAKVFD